MATICSWHWLHVRLYSLPLFILASSLHFFICSIFVFRFCSNHVGIAFGVINQFSSRSHTVQWFQLRSINSPIKIEKIEYEKMKWNIFNCHGIEITFVCRSWEERRDESHVFVFFLSIWFAIPNFGLKYDSWKISRRVHNININILYRPLNFCIQLNLSVMYVMLHHITLSICIMANGGFVWGCSPSSLPFLALALARPHSRELWQRRKKRKREERKYLYA